MLKSNNSKPSGSTAMALSLLLPFVCDKDWNLSNKFNEFCTVYDKNSKDPICLKIPCKNEIEAMMKMRTESISCNIKLFQSKKQREQQLEEQQLEWKNQTFVKIRSFNKLNESVSSIPRIIHSLWLSPDSFYDHLPIKYTENYLSSRNVEGWKHVIWTNKDVLMLLHTLEIDDSIIKMLLSTKKIITLCDVFRFIILYACGGLYADLDFYLLDTNGIIELDSSCVLFHEIPEHVKSKEKLFNGVVASNAGNKFVKEWINFMISFDLSASNLNVFDTTGPYLFYTFYPSFARILRLN